MDQHEYCSFWSRSDGYIHCLDCLNNGECEFYDFLTRFDPLDPRVVDVNDVAIEFCEHFVVSG